MRIRLIGLAAIVGLASALPLLAFANHVDVRDPNDVRGVLDVRRVTHSGGNRPVWGTITFSRWSVEQIFDYGYFLVRLDTFGNTRYDYYALVRSDGYRLRGTLVRDRRSKPDRNVAKVSAWHPEADTMKVRVPLSKMRLGEDRRTYTWRLHTLFTSNACPRVCIDDAPNKGGVQEPIPGREPLPTVTPTGTPTALPTDPPNPLPSP
jgi:hypothetical protein